MLKGSPVAPLRGRPIVLVKAVITVEKENTLVDRSRHCSQIPCRENRLWQRQELL